jgi:hypothetical protein
MLTSYAKERFIRNGYCEFRGVSTPASTSASTVLRCSNSICLLVSARGETICSLLRLFVYGFLELY